MKLKITFWFLLIGATFSAQNQRFIYQYQFAMDSLRKDSIKSEWMVLDVKKEGSRFYSKALYISDSITLGFIRKNPTGEIIESSGVDVNVSDMVEKKDSKAFLMTAFGTYYRISDDRPMNWKIEPEKKKIEEWNTQKATLDFAGRKWIAWFTSEIPIPEGPYKFHALPGLIVKIESADHTHSFELKGIQKLTGTWGPAISWKDYSNAIKIDTKEYEKQMAKYNKDRNAHLRQTIAKVQMERKGQPVKVMVEGSLMRPAAALHYLDEKEKIEKEKNNNPLELNLN